MGNQESVPSGNYIIKKKVRKPEPEPETKPKPYPKPKSYPEPYPNKDTAIRQPQFTNNNFGDQNFQQGYRNDNIQYNDRRNYHNENINADRKQPLNNIIERTMMNDVYNNNNINNISMMNYPGSSNNELTNPKINLDKIEFTPYNFTDEVDKFKKHIINERSEEDIRREKFEKAAKDKEEYLKSQINKFEEKYNPWEILGLEQDDLETSNIKKAYKKMALKFHPDKAGPKYESKFQLITQAYIYLLKKSEEYNELDIKIKKPVEKMDYEDNINEKVENIYIDKDNFNVNNFNKIFDKYKIPSSFDQGYSNLFNQEIKKEKESDDNAIFGKKFNNDVFNSHFNEIKNKKNVNQSVIRYDEPMAMESALNSNLESLGIESVEDFGSMNNNSLSYTDYKKAHIDENLLIDADKVSYKTYKSVDQLENDRSNISYTPSSKEKQRYEYQEKKRLEEDNFRAQQMRMKDDMISNHYKKVNQRMIKK